MYLTRKQITYIKIIGFLMMILLMVVLNNNQENARSNSRGRTGNDIAINVNNSGIAPLALGLPEKTEATLPLKLISNPNSNFLFLFNQCRELKNSFQFVQFKKLFFGYRSKIQNNFIIEFLATIRNKDIRLFLEI